MLAVATIEPARRSIMCGSAARIVRKTPVRLTAITRSQSSSGVECAMPLPAMPALAISTSSCPKRSIASSTARVDRAGVAHVGGDRVSLAPARRHPLRRLPRCAARRRRRTPPAPPRRRSAPPRRARSPRPRRSRAPPCPRAAARMPSGAGGHGAALQQVDRVALDGPLDVVGAVVDGLAAHGEVVERGELVAPRGRARAPAPRATSSSTVPPSGSIRRRLSLRPGVARAPRRRGSAGSGRARRGCPRPPRRCPSSRRSRARRRRSADGA